MHPFMTCAYVSTGLKLNHHLAASTPPFLTHRLMNKTHEACREAAIATKILQRWTCRQLLGYFPWRCVRLPKIGWYFGKWKLVTSSHFLAFLMYIYIYMCHICFLISYWKTQENWQVGGTSSSFLKRIWKSCSPVSGGYGLDFFFWNVSGRLWFCRQFDPHTIQF